MSTKAKLFENSESEDENVTLKTNTSYAKHYDEFRKKEVLSHLKNISDDEDTSSDDASTDEELVNPEFDKEFLKSLSFLKSKDPKKYERIPKFFENVPSIEQTIKERQAKKGVKPITVADYQRERLIKTEGHMSEDESEIPELNPEDLSYAQEQEKIKRDLKQALADSDDEDDANLFNVRDKTKEEIEQEQQDYLRWLAGQKTDIGEDAKELKPLKDFWGSNKIPKADLFLRDYIINKRYVEAGEVPSYDDIVGLSDDEQEVEKQSEYEHKYNFRFEEPDEDFIKRFPRNIEDSVRAQDNARKEKRKEREERKQKEKELKMKELRELQSVRKREIEQKLLLLKEVTGNEDLPLKEDDLNSDFDPDEHDRRMAEMFNNDYYGIDEGEQKPEFPDIDEELGIEDWDNFDKSKIPNIPENDFQQPHCEDDDFVMDCDYYPEVEKKKKIQDELIEMTKGRKKRKRISKLAEAIKKEKPSYDPSSDKTYAEYLDEYYKLDYEDIIGDQPCRFRYSECVPNDFGLSVEEIMLASNKELNQWASLKKTMQNRPNNVEKNDVEKYNRKRNNISLKKKIFASIYGQSTEDDGNADGKPNDDENSVQKALKELDPKTLPAETVVSSPLKNNKEVNKKSKKKKKKKTGVPVVQKNINLNSGQKTSSEPKINEKKMTDEDSTKTDLLTTFKSPLIMKLSRSRDDAKNKFKTDSNNQQQRLQKRKYDSADVTGSHKKKAKFENKTKGQNQEKSDISDNRLKAYGINPKKHFNKIKYAGKDKGRSGVQKKKFINKNKL